MNMKHFADVMTNVKLGLIGLGFNESEAQDMINRHYMVYKDIIVLGRMNDIMSKILYAEFPAGMLNYVQTTKLKEEPTEPKSRNVVETVLTAFGIGLSNVIDDGSKGRYYPSTNDDSFFSGPSLWECDPFTGCDMYGNSYSGNF